MVINKTSYFNVSFGYIFLEKSYSIKRVNQLIFIFLFSLTKLAHPNVDGNIEFSISIFKML